MSKRIMTKLDWLEHRVQVGAQTEVKGFDDREKYLDGCADLAAYESNKFHNPATGHTEFYPDTPKWIVDMAYRNGWHSPECDLIQYAQDRGFESVAHPYRTLAENVKLAREFLRVKP